MKRPVGVTIIAILTIVSGILGTLGGLSLMAFGALFSTVPLDTNNYYSNNRFRMRHNYKH